MKISGVRSHQPTVATTNHCQCLKISLLNLLKMAGLTSSGFDLKVDVVWQRDFIGDIRAVVEHDFLIGVRQDGIHLDGDVVRGESCNLDRGLLQGDGGDGQDVSLEQNCLWKVMDQLADFKSPKTDYNWVRGLVVMGEDSCSRVCVFESQQWILDGHVFTFICCKICILCLKRLKISKKESSDVQFKKADYHICSWTEVHLLEF